MADAIGASGRTSTSLGFDADGHPLPGPPTTPPTQGAAAVVGLGALAAARRHRSGDPRVGPPTDAGPTPTDTEPAGSEPTPGEPEGSRSGLDRRSLLTRIGVASAVAWTVPAIVSVSSAAAASGPPSPCGGCQAPALVNPDAETGNLTGWTGVNAGVQTWLSTNTVPPTGGGLRAFVVYGPTGSLAQTVAVPPACTTGSHTYAFGFVYSAAFNGTALRAEIEFLQGATPLQIDSVLLGSTPNASPPPGFVTAPGSLTGSVPNGADSATIRFLATDWDAVVDEVRLTFC